MNFTDKNADAQYGLLSDQKSWNGRALLAGCVVPGAGSRWRVATHEVKTCGTMLRRESAPTDEALMSEGRLLAARPEHGTGKPGMVFESSRVAMVDIQRRNTIEESSITAMLGTAA